MNKKEGLTIVELLVTISIIASVLVVTLVLGDRTVSQSGLFAVYTQATFLTKEGIELITDETIRDVIKYYIGESTDPRFFEVSVYDDDGNLVRENCSVKMRNNNSGFYGFDGATVSLFSRCITAEKNGNVLKIKVETSFNYKGEEYSVELYRVFYD